MARFFYWLAGAGFLLSLLGHVAALATHVPPSDAVAISMLGVFVVFAAALSRQKEPATLPVDPGMRPRWPLAILGVTWAYAVIFCCYHGLTGKLAISDPPTPLEAQFAFLVDMCFHAVSFVALRDKIPRT